jgi:Phage portal protein, SPP1 Gp6-like
MPGIIARFDSPIIEGLTNWQRTRITIPGLAPKDWPPDLDPERMTRYEEYTALIENRAADVFDDLNLRPDQKTKIALAVALPELICNVWADSVWSDPPTIELPDNLLTRWTAIDTANDWTEIGAWESVFAAAAYGHSILRLYRSDDRPEGAQSDVVIEEIDAAIYFPVMRRGSSRRVDAVILAWTEDRSAPDDARADDWQVRELYEIENGQLVITKQERRAQGSGGLGGPAAFQRVDVQRPDGVGFLPFVDLHAKRWRNRYWGVSEISRAMTLIDELDNTLSNIAEILEYHGKPMLQVPRSTLYGGVFFKGADRTMGVRSEDADIARYVTYDGQIASQLESIDKLVELIFLTVEIPRTYFGLGELPAAPSGTSLKLQLQNYLKKADRWQRNESLRSRALIDMALRLEGLAPAVQATITHGSPLPVDDEQEARIEAALVGAGLSSRETSITRLRRVKDVEAEIQKIDDDAEATAPPLPVPIMPRQIGPGTPPPDGAAG